jgi:hypothetical protein
VLHVRFSSILNTISILYTIDRKLRHFWRFGHLPRRDRSWSICAGRALA